MTHEEVAYYQGRDSIINALCDWMLKNGFSTGHGDNIGAVLDELGEQVADIRRQRDAERERCATIVENLHRVLSGPGDDPDPKYRTDEAHAHLERSLTEIALEAIRNP